LIRYALVAEAARDVRVVQPCRVAALAFIEFADELPDVAELVDRGRRGGARLHSVLDQFADACGEVATDLLLEVLDLRRHGDLGKRLV
jgi:hypothetical protein